MYLDAMGITTWVKRDTRTHHVVLTDDILAPLKSELVAEVLSLVGYQVADCRFVKKALSTDNIIWDMRLVNRPHKPGILYSLPLAKLQQDHTAKSALWQQLQQHKNFIHTNFA